MIKILLINAGMLLAFSVSLSPVYAEQAATTVSPEVSSKTEFKNSYKAYQTLSDAGKWQESLVHAKKAYKIGQKLYADKPETLVALTDNYGLNLMQLRQYDEAAPVLLEALGFYEKVHGLESPELILPLMDLSNTLAKPKNGTKHRQYLQRAITLSETHNGQDSAEHGQMLIESALIFSKAGEKNNVNNYLKKGHEILATTLGEMHPLTGKAAYNLGSMAYANQRYNKATKHLEAALKSFEFPDEPTNQYELKTHSLLVRSYEMLKQREKATKHCLAIGRMTPRTDDQEYLPLIKIAPIYPASAANRNQQGSVTVEYSVDESGFVVNPVVIDNNTGSKDIEKASIEAALKFRYAPGFVDGDPVLTKGVKNRFKYELR